MLHAAEGQTRIGSDHAVDEDAAGLELVYELLLLLVVIGPGGGAEAESRRVRELNRCVYVVAAEQHGDRPEDLFAGNFGRWIDVDEYGWFVEVPWAIDALATGEHARARRDCFLHLLIQILDDLRCREWTDLGCLFQRIADAQRFHLFDKSPFKLFVNFGRNDEALRRDARLPVVDGACFYCRRDRFLQIR